MMRDRLSFLAPFFLFTFISLPMMAAGKVVFLNGKATISGKALTKNTVVKAGASLSCPSNCLAVIKFDTGSTLKINANSTVKIKDLNTEKNKASFFLTKGSSFFKQDPKKKGKLFVGTKTSSMGVRGTQFFVSDEKKDLFMCVNTGSVWVFGKKNKDKVIVKAGEGVRVGDRVSKPRFLPWTKNLNWNLDPDSGDLENKADIESSYKDPLHQDYD